MVLIAPVDPAQMVMFCALATQVAKALLQSSDSGLAGKPCVCNNGQRDAVRNPGFTGNGITCNTLEPCMLNKIGDNQMQSSFTFSSPSCSLQTCFADESRMADCLPECTTLQRTNIVQVSIMSYHRFIFSPIHIFAMKKWHTLSA
jgi:hypothetical protein